jgi:PAS domain S-box-containing protein
MKGKIIMHKSLSVLFVADSEMYTEKILKKLHDSGYDVSFSRVENVSRVRTALDDARWDIIVADFFLPTLDPFSLFNILHEKGMKIPCIAVSDQTDPEKLIAAMKSGISDYILSANLDRLIPAVEHALAGAQAISQINGSYEDIHRVAKQWESIFNSTSDMIWISDLNLKILRFNKALADFVRKPSAMISERKCSEVFHGLDKPSSKCPYNEVLASRKPVTAELYDSFWNRHFQLTISPVFDDREAITATVHIVRDITDKVKIEEELRTAESLYRSISQNSHSGIAIVQNGKIVYANPYVISDYGYTEEALLGKEMLDFVYPEDRDNTKINVIRMLKRQSCTIVDPLFKTKEH